jgi:hypothetical protein
MDNLFYMADSISETVLELLHFGFSLPTINYMQKQILPTSQHFLHLKEHLNSVCKTPHRESRTVKSGIRLWQSK